MNDDTRMSGAFELNDVDVPGGLPGPGWPAPPWDPGRLGPPGPTSITDFGCELVPVPGARVIRLRLKWAKADGATGYVVGLCAADDMTRPIVSQTFPGTETILDIPPLLPSGPYVLLVYPYANNIQGRLSAPFPVERLEQVQGFNLPTGAPVSWPAVPGANGYWVVIMSFDGWEREQVIRTNSLKDPLRGLFGGPKWLMVRALRTDGRAIPSPIAGTGLRETDGWPVPNFRGSPGGKPGPDWPAPPAGPGDGAPPQEARITGIAYTERAAMPTDLLHVSWAPAGNATGYVVGLCAPGKTDHPILSMTAFSTEAPIDVPRSLPPGPYLIVVYAFNGNIQGYLSQPFPVERRPTAANGAQRRRQRPTMTMESAAE